MSISPKKLFGTDGIRGRANDYPMTPEVALQLGRAVAHVFRSAHVPHPRVVIGKDTRLSNYMFETALQAGICSMGVDAVQLGVLPTPGIAFMARDMRANAGVVISASHNPFEDSGIKFFGGDGFKLADSLEARIEELVAGRRLSDHRVHGRDIGRAYRIGDAIGRYSVFLKSTFPADLDLSGLRIVVDCANGAAYKVAPEVLYELGAEVISIGTEPDGTNINEGAGALHPENLCRKVLELRADLGIALDGDADRCILCDERGQVVDGDAILALLARHMKSKGTLANDTVVATVMSNLGLERVLAKDGLKLERTAVGDRYVVARMREGGFNLGGEQSGHMVMLDLSTTGDGLQCALQVMACMAGRQLPLSDLVSDFERVPQVLESFRVTSKPPLESLAAVSEVIADVTASLAGRGRVVVRYSGTEHKCRVMLEGDDMDLIQGYADAIVAAITREIG